MIEVALMILAAALIAFGGYVVVLMTLWEFENKSFPDASQLELAARFAWEGLYDGAEFVVLYSLHEIRYVVLKVYYRFKNIELLKEDDPRAEGVKFDGFIESGKWTPTYPKKRRKKK